MASKQLSSPSICLILSFFVQAACHGKLTYPVPRGGPIEGYGNKLRPFDDARKVANGLDDGDGCGGKRNDDPGAGKAKLTFKPGQKVEVKWSITIPHSRDRKRSGVRIALQYSSTDSFGSNILAGGVEGDPEYTPLDAGKEDIEAFSVALPKGKTCKGCTLQWLWAAEGDGGYYLGCADIAILDSGSPTTRRRRRGNRRRGSRRRRRRRRRSDMPSVTTTATTTEMPSKSRRRRRRRRSQPVVAPDCQDSKPQTCRRACKPLKCLPNQCAMRKDSCCTRSCQNGV